MNECITISEFLAHVLVYATTLSFVLAKDVSINKKPFDDKKRAWRFTVDYWPGRNDNMIVAFIGGTLGAVLAAEIGVPLIEMAGLHEIAEQAGNLTSIMVCTIYMPKILSKLFFSE